MKKMVKAVFSLMLIVSQMSFLVVPGWSVAGNDGNWEFDELSGRITRYTGYETDLVIPTTIDGWPVKSIGSSAFKENKTIRCVTIPEGVVSIGEEAFAHVMLRRITLPSTLKHIGYDAFSWGGAYQVFYNGTKEQWGDITNDGPNGTLHVDRINFECSGPISEGDWEYLPSNGSAVVLGCHKSGYVSIPSTLGGYPVGVIGRAAFLDCRLEGVQIPSSVTRIDDWAFLSCNLLSDVVIPEGVQYIGSEAFEGCTGLETVTIPHSMREFGNFAFCSEGKNYYSNPKTILYYGTEEEFCQITHKGMGNNFLSIYRKISIIYLGNPIPSPVVIPSPQKLAVNGINQTVEKYNIDGSNYFKLRDLAKLLDGTGSQFDVGWDGDKGVVSITTNHAYTTPNGTELVVGADQSATAVTSSQTIMIDGVIRSDLTVYNIGGSNFFKLRDLGDALGFIVDYVSETNTATVTSV